jgi:hypothetical protein
VFLGWDADAFAGVPSYTVTLPPGGAGVGADGALVFSLADANQASNPRGLRRPGLGAPTHAPSSGAPGAPSSRAPRAPIDLTVELVDDAGHASRVPLASVLLPQPQLDATVWKAWFNARRLPDTVLGTWEIPLSRFAAGKGEGFDPGHVKAIRFVFDRSPAGVVALKDVGFRPG